MTNNKSTTVKPITIMIIIMLIGVMSQFASDNYIPSLPAISAYFQASAGMVKLTMSFYLFGMGTSQIVYGPLADVYGRKPILLIGFGIFLVASLFSACAPNLKLLLLARLIQGIGMGSAIALYRAILRDIASGEQFAKISSILMVVVSLTPPLAPITGGYIQHYFGWRENFILVTLLAFIIGIIVWRVLPETLPQKARKSLAISNIVKTYKQLITNKIFIKNAICSSMVLSILMIYIVVTAFLYQHVLGLTPVQYGWLTAFNAGAMMLGGIINFLYVNKFGLNNLINVGIFVTLFSVTIMLTLGLLHFLNVFVILIPMMFVLASGALISVNLMTLAFNQIHTSIGTAGAVYSGLQVSLIAIISILAAYIPDKTQIPMAILLLLISITLILTRLKHFNLF